MVNIQTTPELYKQYRSCLQKIADIKYAAAVLQWDQETYMPVKSAAGRAKQLATLAEMAHQLFTEEKTGNLLEELAGRNDLPENERINVELSMYDYKKEKKLSAELVRNLSEVTSQSYQSWLMARKNNSFAFFKNDLNRLIELKAQQADQMGYEGHPYNALLNEYERGCTVTLLDQIFTSIEQPLKDLLSKIQNRPQVNDAFLRQYFPRQQQWEFGMQLLRRIGFDFEAGRQDISEHPFTTNFSSKDVRITTRIDEHNIANMTWSCIHELGHALYEQGLPEQEYGLPLGEYASLSIHESQSRLWENNVGRSAGFWNYHYDALLQSFPDQFKGVDKENFYKGINKVQPTLIRTEADELTYHFHVMIRYELEKRLMEGTITGNDIPAYWNEQYNKHLGLKVPDDRTGCLQDVHWSHGGFGYFPTYSLGSFYAAQFYDAAKKQMPSLNEDIATGFTGSLLGWLRTNIHQQGRKFLSGDLCKHITGEPHNISYFLDYGTIKYSNIYNFKY